MRQMVRTIDDLVDVYFFYSPNIGTFIYDAKKIKKTFGIVFIIELPLKQTDKFFKGPKKKLIQ